MSRSTYNYKRKAISIAKDFHYGKETITRLQSAQTENEICHIMCNARKEWEKQ